MDQNFQRSKHKFKAMHPMLSLKTNVSNVFMDKVWFLSKWGCKRLSSINEVWVMVGDWVSWVGDQVVWASNICVCFSKKSLIKIVFCIFKYLIASEKISQMKIIF